MAVHDYEADEVQALFADALGRSATERAQFLDEACAGRPTGLRAAVESLLAAHDNAGSFLATADTPGALLRGVQQVQASTGDVVGGFRLLDLIGAGGMGAVYVAERADGEFDQRVAIKLMAVPAWSSDALRRFQAERQILASLRHPHIVTLLDGGLTGDGRAYLAMEFVEGAPITAHCARRSLSVASRLGLFQLVCAAVQHAHRHSVVHRDLKPANILVTPDGVPKILDFGIAKLVESSAPSAAATRTGLLQPLTANYASPEQLRGLPATTVSDVYALGVLLHELLSGVRPYDTSGKPLDAVLTLVGTDRRWLPSAAARSQALRRSLRGDLDAIVSKAMHSDPDRRYASPAELAEDVRRHLEGQPVLAREPALGYQVRRLVGRHRAAAVATMVSVAALVLALAVSMWQTGIARSERARAQQRFGEVRRLANTLMFDIHDAVAPLPGSTPVRERIVGEALTYLEQLNQGDLRDPELQLDLARGYWKIASVQGLPTTSNLGRPAEAVLNYETAIDLLSTLAAAPDAPADVWKVLARTALDLSYTAANAGDSKLARDALTMAKAGVQDAARAAPDSTEVRRLLGSVLFREALVAEPTARIPAWEAASEVFDGLLAESPNDPDRQRNVALVNKYLGGAYEGRGEPVLALRHYQRAYELDRQRLNLRPDDRSARLDVAVALSTLAGVQAKLGNWSTAAELFEDSLVRRRELADEDPDDAYAGRRVVFALSRLGNAYSWLGRHDEAIRHLEQAVSENAAYADATTDTALAHAESLLLLGGALTRAGRHGDGCDAWRRAARAVDVVRQEHAGRGLSAGLEGVQDQATELLVANCDSGGGGR